LIPAGTGMKIYKDTTIELVDENILEDDGEEAKTHEEDPNF
jgi:hypothetical protein